MGMTMTQKILAAHAGLDHVVAGQLIEANLDVVLACGICKNISRSEVHQLVDMIYDTYTRGNPECSGDEE